jgi:HEAT repeat protein
MNRKIVASLGCLVILSACSDPKDPQTWIKQLKDSEKSEEAIRQLQKLGDPVAVKPLSELFTDTEDTSVLKAIAAFNHKDSIPTMIRALDYTEDRYNNATTAAQALAKLKAKEGVPALLKLLDRPMRIKSRSNLAKLAAISALAKIGDKKAVPGLIKVLERRPEEQDFMLNKISAMALGELGDPAAAEVLVRALFMASTVQGSSYPQARVALVQLGPDAAPALLKAMSGTAPKLNAMARELAFKEGVVLAKTSRVLGDLAAKEAVPALLDIIKKTNLRKETKLAGVIEALGKIGDPRSLDPLLKILKDKKVNWRLRYQIALAMPALGDRRALPTLLKVAEKGYIQGGYDNLREAAAMGFARMAGVEAEKAKPIFEAMIKGALGQTQQIFKEAKQRLDVGLECKGDPACYGKKLTDPKMSLVVREKAGAMLAVLPNGRDALPALVKALPVKEPVLRLFFLNTAKRIGKASDTELVKALKELIRKDKKRKVKFLGADLLSEDRIALAVVSRH